MLDEGVVCVVPSEALLLVMRQVEVIDGQYNNGQIVRFRGEGV